MDPHSDETTRDAAVLRGPVAWATAAVARPWHRVGVGAALVAFGLLTFDRDRAILAIAPAALGGGIALACALLGIGRLWSEALGALCVVACAIATMPVAAVVLAGAARAAIEDGSAIAGLGALTYAAGCWTLSWLGCALSAVLVHRFMTGLGADGEAVH